MSNSPRIRPINDQVLVRRLDSSEKSGLVIVPDSAKPLSMEAEVLAVGPGSRHAKHADTCATRYGPLKPLTVKPGDRVLMHPATQVYGRDLPAEISLGEDELIVREDSILAVLE